MRRARPGVSSGGAAPAWAIARLEEIRREAARRRAERRAVVDALRFKATAYESLVTRLEKALISAEQVRPAAVPRNVHVGAQELGGGAFLTVAEVARRCAVTEPTVREWIGQGRLAASRIGGGRIYRVRLADLAGFLAGQQSQEGAAHDPREVGREILTRLQHSG